MKVKICLDSTAYHKKPTKNEIPKISQRIASEEVENTIEVLAKDIGVNGCSWTPATFNNEKRSNDDFKCQQLFALDFDSGISFTEIMDRAEKYHIPIAFIYETFSSIKESKFRVVFLHCSEIVDVILAKYIQTALMSIFKECDKACKDVARMYFGGKKILYINNDYTNLCFNFNHLTMMYVEYLRDTYGCTHYLNKVKDFSIKTGVILINNLPYIKVYDTDNTKDGDGNSGASPIRENSIIIRNVSQLPNFYSEIHFRNTTIKNDFSNNNISTGRRSLIRNFNWDELYHSCELYYDFIEGNHWFYHPQLFGIATNFIQIKGGGKKFLEILNSEQNSSYLSYKEKNWNFYLNYIEKVNYNAMNCKGFCPYCNSCEHCKNMIDNNKVKRHDIVKIKDEKYVSIEEAASNLEQNFLDAQKANDTCIHLIKAQTGLGKSFTYLKYLNDSDKFYIIALPTNKLKQEIFEKASHLNYKVIATPELPKNLPEKIRKRIQHFYNIGAYKRAMQLIRKLSKEENIEELNNYIEDLKKAYNSNGHILTTHARLLTFPPSMLKKYNVIIDEDIMRNLLSIQHVTINDLSMVLKCDNIPREIRDRISKIIYCTENNSFKKIRPLNVTFIEKEINQIIGKKISSNVIDFLKANVIYKSDNIINFLIKRALPKMKFIIMSATADEEIYYRYFGEDRVKIYNCKKAKYKGKIYQYYEKSCSRTSLLEDEDLIKKINSLTKGKDAITFKKLKELFENTSELHFGNTEGHNFLEGKDIAVVGTPHLIEEVYKMYGTALGIDVNKEKLSYQQIENENYKFWFMTYKNPILRKIQLWLIESELEQCVGRARILRNDCNVFLFSNFPLEQAQFCTY